MGAWLLMMKEKKGWFELRFTPDAKKHESNCEQCGRSMFLPKSKTDKYKTCGGECAKLLRKEKLEKGLKERERVCIVCKKTFTPREYQISVGAGRFCSHKCNLEDVCARNGESMQIKATARMAELRSNGEINYKYGEEHHSWTGGKQAYREREKEKYKVEGAKKQREYRGKNPERVREWSSRRKRGKIMPRLPRGTITNLKTLQKTKCAICKVSIVNGYHVDHILPIKLGGKHEPHNLQLLCQNCNLTKSAKHPVDFMQEKGFLI